MVENVLLERYVFITLPLHYEENKKNSFIDPPENLQIYLLHTKYNTLWHHKGHISQNCEFWYASTGRIEE